MKRLSDRRVMVVAVHPDDETLGAGGTLLRLREDGAKLGWLIVTHMAERYGWPGDRIAQRKQEIDTVADSFGFDYVRNLELRPAGLDAYPLAEIVQHMRVAFDEWQPDTIVLPFWEDAHSDHQVAFRAAKSCLKKFRSPYLRRAYSMEVVSETNFSFPGQFKPQVYSDVTETLDRKIDIFGIYASEMQEHPFPRSADAIRALATLRGSEAGMRHAEAFQMIAAFDGLL